MLFYNKMAEVVKKKQALVSVKIRHAWFSGYARRMPRTHIKRGGKINAYY